jgi:hypothetical protein
MRAQFLLVPFATLAIISLAHATVFMSVEQAQKLMFPGATLTPEFRELSREQASAIEKASGVSVRSRTLRMWRASTGGWFIADEVLGKHEYIPFALALDNEGAVKSMEILEYRETYGSEIRNEAWREQFRGKRYGASLKLNSEIQNISGATLSSRHITDGVKRLLATYALVCAQD